jgi:hypothetical protein
MSFPSLYQEGHALFVAAGPRHQFADRVLGRLAMLEDGGHLLGDGHLHFVCPGQSECSRGRPYAFSDFALKLRQDRGKPMPPAEFNTHGAVARKRTGAGEHQVAQPGKAGQRFPGPPQATARRVISAMPRVMMAAALLCPRPSPDAIPAAIAMTFLSAPPISTPITSSLV